jgi:2-keto-4-pentenoate hydratase/2-oxohepta-3-ene-1,7-dioic acid hydratase in catechol pathway
MVRSTIRVPLALSWQPNIELAGALHSMKLLSFAIGEAVHLGALRADGSILDLTLAAGDADCASMQSLIEAGPPALERARRLVDASHQGIDPGAVRWLAPLPAPIQIRDFLVFEEHMRMAGWNGAKLRALHGAPPAPAAPPPVPAIWYEQPIYYKCNRFAVAGTGSTVRWPTYSRVIDYELELACVIGRKGRDIQPAHASDYIFGYTIFNDLTARDAQFKEMQGPLGPAKGKDFDGANVFGPVIVTADSLDAGNLRMRAWVNGELRCDNSSDTMHWSFNQILEHVSRSETLYPGEILGSGTVGGGCGLETGRFLKHGDRIELEIEQIGKLGTVIDAPHVLTEITL